MFEESEKQKHEDFELLVERMSILILALLIYQQPRAGDRFDGDLFDALVMPTLALVETAVLPFAFRRLEQRGIVKRHWGVFFVTDTGAKLVNIER